MGQTPKTYQKADKVRPSISRTAENCCLQHPSSKFNNSNTATQCCQLTLGVTHHSCPLAVAEELPGWLQASVCANVSPAQYWRTPNHLV